MMAQYNIVSISEKLLDKIEELFDHFGIIIRDNYDNRIMFPCPIHSGDNPTGSSIMKVGIGNWMCFTHQCHEDYGNSNGASIIQFVQALLKQSNGKEYSFGEAMEWAAKFVGEDRLLSVLPPSYEDNTRTQFIHLCKYLNRKKTPIPVFVPRKSIRSFLKIPAEYYLKRGYTAKILHKFDIGYCFNTNKSFYDRVITPFYDDLGEYMVGCSGRNKFEQCANCLLFHQEGIRCPLTKEERLRATKWKHSTNFAVDSYLYNYWNAKSHILKSNTVILVEGSGDVWRLEEAGVYNSVGLLGAKLLTNQQIILEESGAINLIIATDNDTAGNKAAESITKNCRNLFNIKRIVYPSKDPGSLTIEQVKQIFIPVLERI